MNYDLDYAKAEKDFLAARDIDESYARMWHGFGLLRAYQGRVEEAFQYFGRARELESTQLLYTGSYGNLLYHTRKYEEAIAHARSLLASQPRFDAMRHLLIRALVANGDVKGAIEQLPLRFSEVPFTSEDGLVYAHAGRRDEALAQIERLERRAREGFGMSYEIAVIYAALGDKEKGCAALLRSLTDHSQWIGWMKLDPRMDPLRERAVLRRGAGNVAEAEKGPQVPSPFARKWGLSPILTSGLRRGRARTARLRAPSAWRP